MNKFDVKMMRVNDLTIHPLIQRDLKDHWVEHIKTNFDVLGVGVLTAFENQIVDGQHRWQAMRDLDMGDTEVPVMMYYDLTEEQQAHVFQLLNKRIPVDPYSTWKLGIIEQDPNDLAIKELVERAGWRFAPTNKKGPGKITCISTVKNLYRRDKIAFSHALDQVTDLWGHDAAAANQVVLDAFWQLYRAHGDVIRTRERQRILKAYPDAQSLVNSAPAYRQNKTKAYGALVAIKLAAGLT